jgi:hypothetical protein
MASRKIKQNVEPPTNYCAFRNNVCVPENEHQLTEYDGNCFCFFHLPTLSKDSNVFRRILKKRLKDIELEIKNPTEDRLYPKYDFRYVWFPEAFFFTNYRFNADADFGNAVFTDEVSFSRAKFFGNAIFESTIFLKKANFSLSNFYKQAKFTFAIFEEGDFNHVISHMRAEFNFVFFRNGKFIGAEFKDDIEFRSSIFLFSSFHSAIFCKNGLFNGTVFIHSSEFSFVELLRFETRISADFRFAEFKDTSYVVFENAKFCCSVSFFNAKVNGYLNFEGNVFLESNELVEFSDKFENEINNLLGTFEKKKIDNFLSIVDRPKEAILDFQKVKIADAKEVSFHSCVLRPNWFVNVDSRKIVFTNTEWKNVNNKSKHIESELNSLKFGRLIKNPIELLKIAFRQLAENAENNNRYEEASNFRQVAFECERLGKKAKLTEAKIANFSSNDFDTSEEFNEILVVSEKMKRSFGNSEHTTNLSAPLRITFRVVCQFILNKIESIFNFIGKTFYSIYHFDYIHFLYRITSFYGESWGWALGVLLSLILVIFPIIYTQINFQTCSKDRPIAASLTVCESKDEEIRKNCTCSTDRITFTDAIVQSLTTATLQNVEYRKPLTVWGELWIILEKIFAPLQAALLALAIRRKFMR